MGCRAADLGTARRDLRVGPLRLLHRELFRQRDHALKRWPVLLQAIEVDPRQALARDGTGLDPARQPSYRREGDIRIAHGSSSVVSGLRTIASASGVRGSPQAYAWNADACPTPFGRSACSAAADTAGDAQDQHQRCSRSRSVRSRSMSTRRGSDSAVGSPSSPAFSDSSSSASCPNAGRDAPISPPRRSRGNSVGSNAGGGCRRSCFAPVPPRRVATIDEPAYRYDGRVDLDIVNPWSSRSSSRTDRPRRTWRVVLYTRARRAGRTRSRSSASVHRRALHDVGKIDIPDAILTKADRLTDAEFDIIKTHTTLGHDRLVRERPTSTCSGLSAPTTNAGTASATRWSGRRVHRARPRFFAVIDDAFDAMTSIRPYRDRIGEDAAELAANSKPAKAPATGPRRSTPSPTSTAPNRSPGSCTISTTMCRSRISATVLIVHRPARLRRVEFLRHGHHAQPALLHQRKLANRSSALMSFSVTVFVASLTGLMSNTGNFTSPLAVSSGRLRVRVRIARGDSETRDTLLVARVVDQDLVALPDARMWMQACGFATPSQTVFLSRAKSAYE